MREDFLVTIKGTMERDGDSDTIELMTRGNLLCRPEGYYIVYRETEATGFQGCTTGVKVTTDARCVTMTRFGEVTSRLVIEKGTRHLCHYDTEYGALSLGVSADEIECSLNPDGGWLKFSYLLDSGAEDFISRNLVNITVEKLPQRK